MLSRRSREKSLFFRLASITHAIVNLCRMSDSDGYRCQVNTGIIVQSEIFSFKLGACEPIAFLCTKDDNGETNEEQN